MCIFSQPVVSVTNTNIFARMLADGWQHIVYQMDFESAKDNAIILPLPVTLAVTETESLEFISLQDYGNFFEDLRKGFPRAVPKSLRSDSLKSSKHPTESKIVVHEVGDFVASFVPSQADFERLDEQFRIPKESWDQIPKYSDYGFAVFQLSKRSGKPHPMAFKFHSRLNTGDKSSQIFFPTVHIHDGEVHQHEHFDHSLFLQSPVFDAAVGDYNVNSKLVADDTTGYVRSKWNAESFCDIDSTLGIIEPHGLVHLKTMKGDLKNDDILVSLTFDEAEEVSSNSDKNLPKPDLASSAGIAGAAGMAWFFDRRSRLINEKKKRVQDNN
jgi:hypothetical protein